MRIASFLDLETTGFLEPEHRIVEFALCLYDYDTGAKLGGFVRRFNPGRTIEAKAEAVHGISFASVSHLPTLDDSHEWVDKVNTALAKSSVVVAHNGFGFDFPFVQQEWARIGKNLPNFRKFDTMVDGRWATPFGKLPNLGELCFATRTEYDPDKAHGAEYDVDVMAQSFFFAKQRGFYYVSELENELKAA